MNNIPSCGFITFYLCIHQLMNIWVVSAFWLLQILLWTFIDKFLCGHVFNSLGDTYKHTHTHTSVGMELLGHKVTCNILKKLPNFFSKWLYPFRPALKFVNLGEKLRREKNVSFLSSFAYWAELYIQVCVFVLEFSIFHVAQGHGS